MITRRGLLGGSASLLLASCKPKATLPASCTDTTGLSSEEIAARTTLGYVEPSAQGDKTCSACVQFVAPAASGQCGACKLLKGPIHPRGGCKAFAAKA